MVHVGAPGPARLDLVALRDAVAEADARGAVQARVGLVVGLARAEGVRGDGGFAARGGGDGEDGGWDAILAVEAGWCCREEADGGGFRWEGGEGEAAGGCEEQWEGGCGRHFGGGGEGVIALWWGLSYGRVMDGWSGFELTRSWVLGVGDRLDRLSRSGDVVMPSWSWSFKISAVHRQGSGLGTQVVAGPQSRVLAWGFAMTSRCWTWRDMAQPPPLFTVVSEKLTNLKQCFRQWTMWSCKTIPTLQPSTRP